MRWLAVAAGELLLLLEFVHTSPDGYDGMMGNNEFAYGGAPDGYNGIYGPATPSPNPNSEEQERQKRQHFLRMLREQQRNANSVQGELARLEQYWNNGANKNDGDPPPVDQYNNRGDPAHPWPDGSPPPPPPPSSNGNMNGRYNGGNGPPPNPNSRYPPPPVIGGRQPPPPKLQEQARSLGLGLGIGIPLFTIAALLVGAFFVRRYIKSKQRRVPRIFDIQPNGKPNPYQKHKDSPALKSADPWELERARLTINFDKKLGSGAFCNVFKGQITGEAPVCRMSAIAAPASLTNCFTAVKMLPSFADDIARSDFMQEINFMKSLKYHPHLVSMLGWVADRKSPLLLVEYCENGDLLHFIRDKKPEVLTGYENVEGLKIRDIVSFSWQISNGLEYLNSVGCIHRDIAARNILVDSLLVCKIGDFGLCRLTDSLLYTARGGRLPLKWMAPESLRSYEYSFKSDVWSYGILLYELFSLGEVPFAFIQNNDLLPHIDSGGRPPRPEWEIITSCWREQPLQRPSFGMISSKLIHIVEANTDNYGYVRPTPLEPIVEVEDV